VKESYTFWSSDFHISPIADLKDLFEPMGMKVRPWPCPRLLTTLVIHETDPGTLFKENS
jgi:hypothetical protein